MSQNFVSDEISEQSKKIENHLNSVNIEPWFSRNRKSQAYENEEIDICPQCENFLEKPYWESRYNGIQGRCKKCEITWNLS